MAVSDRLIEPFLNGDTFLHGVTFAGHPVSAAVALANIEVFEKEGLLENVRTNESSFKASLDTLADLPIVGDIRGAGYFTGSSWSRTRTPGRPSMTTKSSASCGASCPAPSTRPASSAGPTTGVTRWCSWRLR